MRGFGLRRGAFATTVAHDAHNIVAVGVDDATCALCVERLAEIGGGIAIAEDGAVRAELALPVAGLMSDAAGRGRSSTGLEELQRPAARAGRRRSRRRS